MDTYSQLQQQLFNHLNQKSTSFSIGCFGAIAEFHRLPDNTPLVQEDSSRLESITAEGAIRIQLTEQLCPIAYEIASKDKQRWRHGVAFCLPEAAALMAQRNKITETGPDQQAILKEHRDQIVFDLGLGVKNIDFCIRTDHAGLIETLRQCTGQSFFALDTQVKDEILRLNPHRLVLSKAGRIEVYQSIGRDKTPAGSHTHLLPKLLATGRTHSANVPIPDSFLPVLQMYPESPLSNDSDGNTVFNSKAFDHFQQLLHQWGEKAYVVEKRRVKEAILSDARAEDYPMPSTRHVRTAIRVTIRQLKYQNPGSDNLKKWEQFFNPDYD